MATDRDRVRRIEELKGRLDELLRQVEAARSEVEVLATSEGSGDEPDPSALIEQIKRLEPAQRRKLQEGLAHLDLEVNEQRGPYRDLEGILGHLGAEVTEEDIAEARREMWGNFPRDVEL